MASMKPSYPYDSSQSSYATNSYDYKLNQSSHNYKAENSPLSRPKPNFHNDAYNHTWVTKPSKYYAQAQCAQPSAPLHVVQGNHVVETIEKQESHKSEEWTTGSPKCSSPSRVARSEFSMHKEETVTGKVDQGCANKSNHYANTTQAKEERMVEKSEQGWASKPTQYSGAIQSNQYGYKLPSEEHMLAKAEQGWVNKSSQQAAIVQSNHYGHNEGHMMGKIEQGRATKPTPYLEGTQSNQYIMQDEGHMMGNKEQGWATKSNQYPDTTQVNQYGLAMHKEENMMGKTDNDYANKGYNHAGQGQVNVALQSRHKEQFGGSDIGWATKPANYYGSNPSDHSLQTEYNQNGNHGWSGKPTNTLAPIRTNHAGLGMHNEEHMMNGIGHDWSNSPTNFSRRAQPNHSGLGMYKDEHKMGKMDQVVVGSPGRFSRPVQQNQYGQSMYKEQETEGYNYNGNNIHGGWPNKPSKYSGHNQYGAHSSHDMFNEDAWAGKASHGYSATQANHSAHGAYNYEDHEDCDENVHDIMDEILTKYPAHNVSGGHASGWAAKPGMYMNQNQVTGYAKQQSYGAPAHYESSANSSKKFEMGMNAGYMANMKEEYSSHSSSFKKFETKGMMNNGGLYDECDD